MNIKKIQQRVLLLIAFATLAVSTLFYYTPAALAAGVTAHVRVVGSTKTVWYGDVTTDGCTVNDTTNVSHTYAQPVAVCALDAASKAGGFSYVLKDFGGSLGLFIQTIATDTGASDYSTYWTYDVNGKSATAGISSQTVSNGDTLYFHFEGAGINSNTRAINDGITYLRSQQQNSGAISGYTGVSSWSAMTFAAAGINPDTVINGSTSLLAYIQANHPTSSSSATDWEKDILAITAAGKNPYDFGGTNYIQQMETYHTNGQIGATTQINDDIFGLLALISAGPDAPAQTKQDALNFILAHQNTDGGFSWSTTATSDADDTAAALQALAAAKHDDMTATGLDTAITNAQNYLLSAKNTDGGFASTPKDASNTSTTAWVVMALNALGTDTQDVTTADAYIRSNQEENGSFHWQPSSTGETFTSSYAILALTGKYWPVTIYTASNTVPTAVPTKMPSPTVTVTPTPTVAPTETVTPGITVNPSPSPTPSITQQPKDRLQEIMQREQERLHKIQEQEQRLFAHLQTQMQKTFQHLSQAASIITSIHF